MGADVIYQYKKLLPRVILAMFVWMVCLFMPLMVYGMHWWLPFWVAGISSALFGYFGFEYYRGSKLVKGLIGNVPVSHITRTIFWLSLISTGKVPLNQDFYGYRYVNSVVNQVGGSIKSHWGEAIANHKLVSPNRIYLLLGILLPLALLIPLTQFLNASVLIWAVIGGMMLLFVVYGYVNKKAHEAVEALVKDKVSIQLVQQMTQELIDYASDHAKNPLRVMLAGENYSGIKVVGSHFATLIVEIEPRNQREAAPVFTPVLEKPIGQETQASGFENPVERQQKWEPVWLISVFLGVISSLGLLEVSARFLFQFPMFSSVAVALAWSVFVVVLPFIPIELFFRKKDLNSSIFIAILLPIVLVGIPAMLAFGGGTKKVGLLGIFVGMIVFAGAVCFVAIYMQWPTLKIAFKGGEITPANLESMIARVPSRTLRKTIEKNDIFKGRVNFLMDMLGKGTMNLTETTTAIKDWINKDSTQPSRFRFFAVEGDIITLTTMGTSYAKSIQKKLGQPSEPRKDEISTNH